MKKMYRLYSKICDCDSEELEDCGNIYYDSPEEAEYGAEILEGLNLARGGKPRKYYSIPRVM